MKAGCFREKKPRKFSFYGTKDLVRPSIGAIRPSKVGFARESPENGLMRFALVSLVLSVSIHGGAPESITPQNVSRMKIAWTYDTGESPHVFPAKASHFEATPVYADGKLYISTPGGLVIALDADSGKEIWKRDLHVKHNWDFSEPTTRGVTLAGKSIFLGTPDARLVCMDRTTGEPCEGFGKSGEVSLTAGLRRAPLYNGEYGVSSPPAVYKDVVIVGSYVADNSRAIMATGEVRGFDAKTGALRWTWHPLDAKLSAGAANTWSTIVIDQTSGLVFLPTSSPSPDYFGGLRPGDNRDANSIVVLKAETGEKVWAFQTVHHDLWDYDVASKPLLFPGKDGPAVAVGSKTGHLFLFNRATGKPLFPIEERAVPESDVKGEQSSPTQPFPTAPPALVPQKIEEKDIWGPTPQAREACLAIFHSLRNDGIFTPPSERGSLMVPGNIGGLQWGGATWDSKNRLLIAPVNRFPAVIRLIPSAQVAEQRKAHADRETATQFGAQYGMSRQFFVNDGVPCIAPPWGELVAVNPDTGKIAWRSPLGSFGPDDAHTVPGSPNLGGVAMTETGVAFVGATLDAKLRAFDTSTGREIWKGDLPAAARATPAIYRTAGGREMVAISAGGIDFGSATLDSKIVVFALNE